MELLLTFSHFGHFFLKKIPCVPLNDLILNIDIRVGAMTFGVEVERLGAKGFGSDLCERSDYSVVPMWHRSAP